MLWHYGWLSHAAQRSLVNHREKSHSMRGFAPNLHAVILFNSSFADQAKSLVSNTVNKRIIPQCIYPLDWLRRIELINPGSAASLANKNPCLLSRP